MGAGKFHIRPFAKLLDRISWQQRFGEKCTFEALRLEDGVGEVRSLQIGLGKRVTLHATMEQVRTHQLTTTGSPCFCTLPAISQPRKASTKHDKTSGEFDPTLDASSGKYLDA